MTTLALAFAIGIVVAQIGQAVALVFVLRYMRKALRYANTLEDVASKHNNLLEAAAKRDDARLLDVKSSDALKLEATPDVNAQRALMAHVDEWVDEGIALAEAASKNSHRFAAGKLTGLDKRREAVNHAAGRARTAGVKISSAELAKLVEVRLALARVPAASVIALVAPTPIAKEEEK